MTIRTSMIYFFLIHIFFQNAIFTFHNFPITTRKAQPSGHMTSFYVMCPLGVLLLFISCLYMYICVCIICNTYFIFLVYYAFHVNIENTII